MKSYRVKYRITNLGKLVIAFFSTLLFLLLVFLLKPADNATVINNNTQSDSHNSNIVSAASKDGKKDYAKIIKSCPSPRLTVSFPPNLFEISQTEFKALDQFIFLAKLFDEFKIKIEGYTARVTEGDITPFAVELSLSRAKAVRDYLIRGGIDAARIEIYGLGPENPVALNNTETGRTQNRRAEISFIVLN